VLAYAAVPDFYAEIECSRRPALRGTPVIVGGDPRKRGVVQSASAEARAAGVACGMLVRDALRYAPKARVLRTDMRAYREVTARLRGCFRRETERVEPAEPGAAWLDLAEADAPPAQVAARLRERIAGELALPLRVGLAPLKFVTRIAAETIEGEGVFCVSSKDLRGFLDPLPVSALPGVGQRTGAALAELGAVCVADLLRLGRAVLEERLGNHGLEIHSYAEGRDAARIRALPRPRSLSQECTLERPERAASSIEARIAELAGGLELALRRESLAARRVQLKVRYAGPGEEQQTRTETLKRAVASAAELCEVCGALLPRTAVQQRPVRGLGLAVMLLVLRPRRDDRQPDLFDGPPARGR